MLGKRSSLKILRGYLREKAIDNHVITEFIQGRTHRWGIAWSYSEKIEKLTTKLTLPPDHLEFSTSIPASQVAIEIRQFLINHGIPNEMTSTSSDTKDSFAIDGHVTEDVWSRRARRKKLKLTREEESSRSLPQSPKMPTAYEFHISIRPHLDEDKQTTVQMEKIAETDPTQPEMGHLFLSLHNSIKRHIQTGRQVES